MGASVADSDGRATAVTILSPTRLAWAWWLTLTWPGADRAPLLARFIKRPLYALSFIHFAHWGLIWRLPTAPGGRRRRLARPYLLFISNFNDDPLAYIDAFSLVVPGRMRLMWQGAYRFPGPRPVARFERFITARWLHASHYYSAYPDASMRMIDSALRVRGALGAFAAQTAGADAQEFATAYRQLLTTVLADL